MKRKLMAVALGASMIASMMSVGAFAEESEVVANGDYKFEIIVKSYQSSYWQAAVKGIDSEKDKLKSKANKIAEKIKSGEDFEKLAKENSDDKSTGKNGGYLGYFTKEDKNPEFTKKVFSLDKGQVSDVFETPYGYEIVKVTDKKTKQKSLEDCREDIVNRILAEKYLQHIEKLKDDTTIERN